MNGSKWPLIDLSTLFFVTEVTTVLQIKEGMKIRIVKLRQTYSASTCSSKLSMTTTSYGFSKMEPNNVILRLQLLYVQKSCWSTRQKPKNNKLKASFFFSAFILSLRSPGFFPAQDLDFYDVRVTEWKGESGIKKIVNSW